MRSIEGDIVVSKQTTERPSEAQRKAHGDHYTPPGLALYLARQLAAQWLAANASAKEITVLDPACGDGELLIALLANLPGRLFPRVHVIGCDTNEAAVAEARRRLTKLGVGSVKIRQEDFLSDELALTNGGQPCLDFRAPELRTGARCDSVDMVISNPPYVRTQVLGSAEAQSLARRFRLTGRVDLYHAFVIAMTQALRPGGFLGLLTSNRFLSTQAGTSMRSWFSREFQIRKLVDLGDTKLFDAAVLPAIVIAEKGTKGKVPPPCPYLRMYELRGAGTGARNCQSVLDALSTERSEDVRVQERSFRLEVGVLRKPKDTSIPWILTSDATDRWIKTVAENQSATFADVSKVCVGIKTTADKVFVRDDWESLPADRIPEKELLRNLITHHGAERWSIRGEPQPRRRVLYPYLPSNGSRRVVALEEYPRAARYLEDHRERLQNRQYLSDAGRKWYEIWVAHTPSDWQKPKIAFPDISSENLFFMVDPDWIVNGDCYWITLNPGMPESTLYGMLAVANSTFIVRYYDVMFHNKLYAGRRRFMSQYVNRFPLPGPMVLEVLAGVVRELLDARREGDEKRVAALAAEADAITWESFGLAKEIGR